MVSLDVVAAAGSGAGRVGRYFTVVSALPSSVFFLYVYVLAKTGAWGGHLRWESVATLDPGQLLLVGVAALVLALVLNPVQVGLVRLFEGYWGATSFGRQLAVMRTMHHRRRRYSYLDEQHSAARQ